jgi:hypothetical protein
VDIINESVKRATAATVDHFHKIKCKKGNKRTKRKSWWDCELGKLRKNRAWTSRKIVSKSGKLIKNIKIGSHNSKENLKVLKNLFLIRKFLNRKYKKLIKHNKLMVAKEKRKKLIESFIRDNNLFWKHITHNRGSRVDVDIDLETLKKAYAENFNSIAQSEESKSLENKLKSIVEKYASYVKSKTIKSKVKVSDIVRILKNLKNRKKGGLNSTSNEMFKYGSETLLPKVIAALFENIIRGGFFPNNLNIGLIVTIIKNPGESNSSMDNTRPITLSEVLSVILEHYLLIFIHKRVLHRHQYGFRQKSSCMHAVFTLNEIMADVKKRNVNAYAVYLDFSKAFDKVNRIKLLYKLMYNLTPEIWLLIKNYYENLILHVQDSKGKISEGFVSTVGVKQGGPASPDLFNDYINQLIIILEKSGKTYKIGNLSKGVMVYADDTTLVCSSLKDLDGCLQLIEQYCSLYDIIINAKKTKGMIFGAITSILEPDILVNKQRIEIVDNFKFLGVNIDREGNFKKHIEIRKTAFFAGVTEVERLGICKLDVPVKMKSLLYTSLVRSKLVYGLEGINLEKNRAQKELTGLESNFIKKMCGLNKHSKTTSLMYALNVTPLKLYTYKRKLHFILQLLNNSSTSELLGLGVHETLKDVLDSIGINKDHVRLGENRYRGIIRSLVIRKLDAIRESEKNIRESSLVVSLEYLLSQRTPENNDTLQYLLDPRRCERA